MNVSTELRLQTDWSLLSFKDTEDNGLKRVSYSFIYQSLKFLITSICHSLSPQMSLNDSWTEIFLYREIAKICRNLSLNAPMLSRVYPKANSLSMPTFHLMHSWNLPLPIHIFFTLHFHAVLAIFWNSCTTTFATHPNTITTRKPSESTKKFIYFRDYIRS